MKVSSYRLKAFYIERYHSTAFAKTPSRIGRISMNSCCVLSDRCILSRCAAYKSLGEASLAIPFKEEPNLVAAIGTTWAGHAQTNDPPTVGDGWAEMARLQICQPFCP